MKKYTFGDCLLIWMVMILGLAEVMHVGAVFLGWSVSRCSKLFAVGVAVLALAGLVLGICGLRKREKGFVTVKDYGWYIPFVLLLMSQILFICLGNGSFRNGDMTVETVGSFLVHDGVYRVNPMTGNPYAGGIPLRLEILGLPTLYSMICQLTGVAPVVLVRTVVPVCVLLLSYVAFCVLGDVLFEGKAREKAIFMAVVALLMWIGAYMYGMDGFNLLCCGWRGVTIRNLVLLPWLFSLCLRRGKFGILLCLAAEACIVWTLYGLGACALVTVGMLVADFAVRRYFVRKNSGQEKEETV